MRINGSNVWSAVKLYSSQKLKEGVDKKSNTQEGVSDKLEISSKAKELLELKQKVLDLPEVRNDKVNELKEKLASGEYKVSAEEIAAKILEDL